MTLSIKQRYDDVVRQFAEQYTAQGYVVEREPPIVMEDGSVVRPDLIARRTNGETVMLEVKVNSPAAQPAASLDRLAELAQKHGWRFVIALADSRSVEEIEVADPSVVEAQLQEAQRLDPQSSAAPLLAWAVLEAAARVALARAGWRMLRSHTPRAVIQQLASLGLVSPDEETDLHAFAEMRNRLAHGVWPTRYDPANVRQTLEIAQRLLETRELPASA